MRELRFAPRVDVETFCCEMVTGRERPGVVVDLSAEGMRLERPYFGGPSPGEILIEVEVPDVDEVMWARGEVCFEQVRQGPLGLLRTTGVRLVRAAARDLRMLRDCVLERRRARHREEVIDVLDASCYARG
jgi:hypothetical protein